MVLIILIVVIILVLYILLTWNSLIRLKNRVKESFATMDVYLKKRWDLIPNLVAVVQGYAKHEKETITNITKLRNTVYDDLSTKEKIRTNFDVFDNITKLVALAEDYPDLKANQNYMQLSNDLVKIEDEIAKSRKYYNATVRIYNNKVEMFPSNIVAKITGHKKEMMFEAQKEEREKVSVKL